MEHYIYEDKEFNLVDTVGNSYALTIMRDNYPQNPREWDNIATMICKHVTRQDRCPHCGEIIREYEDEEEVDSCWGFYGDSLEDSGILGYIPADLHFVE